MTLGQIDPGPHWMTPAIQGGAFGALVFVLWWILTKQQPAQTSAWLTALEKINAEAAAVRKVFEDESQKNRIAFEQEMQRHRTESRDRENALQLKVMAKDDQMIALLTDRPLPRPHG